LSTNSGGTTALQAKGRRSKDLVGSGSGNASAGKGVKGLGGDAPTATSAAGKTANWVPVAGLKSMKELPQEENKVRGYLGFRRMHTCILNANITLR